VLLLAGLIAGGFTAWALVNNSDIVANINQGPVNASNELAHRSFFLKSDVYDRGYEGADGTLELDSVSAGIVPHHLLANHKLGNFFGTLGAREQYDTIVLIGPDHMNRSYYHLATSEASWDTPYGKVEPTSDIINELLGRSVIQVDEKIFTAEHSINGLVPFIRRSFPGARIIPITVQANTSNESIDALATALNEILPIRSLVLASVDFAHYVSHEEAMRQNGVNIPLLQQMNPDLVNQLFVDSPQTVRAVLKYLQLREVGNYQLLDSSDSAEVTGEYDVPEVTSYITMYFGNK